MAVTCPHSFRHDSEALREWVGGATGRLHTWRKDLDSTPQDPEIVQTRLGQVMVSLAQLIPPLAHQTIL